MCDVPNTNPPTARVLMHPDGRRFLAYCEQHSVPWSGEPGLWIMAKIDARGHDIIEHHWYVRLVG